MFDKLQKGFPYITALIVFVLLSAIYFSPVLKGKELPQKRVNKLWIKIGRHGILERLASYPFFIKRES